MIERSQRDVCRDLGQSLTAQRGRACQGSEPTARAASYCAVYHLGFGLTSRACAFLVRQQLLAICSYNWKGDHNSKLKMCITQEGKASGEPSLMKHKIPSK